MAVAGDSIGPGHEARHEGCDRIAIGFAAPVLGFGLDLGFDTSLIGLLEAPTIGPLWVPGFAPDGDGLVGLGPITGVIGDGILLARLHFEAIGARARTTDWERCRSQGRF